MIQQIIQLLKKAISEFLSGIKIQGNIRIQIPVNKPKLLSAPRKKVVRKTKKVLIQEG